jgi:hypothetical protein
VKPDLLYTGSLNLGGIIDVLDNAADAVAWVPKQPLELTTIMGARENLRAAIGTLNDICFTTPIPPEQLRIYPGSFRADSIIRPTASASFVAALDCPFAADAPVILVAPSHTALHTAYCNDASVFGGISPQDLQDFYVIQPTHFVCVADEHLTAASDDFRTAVLREIAWAMRALLFSLLREMNWLMKLKLRLFEGLKRSNEFIAKNRIFHLNHGAHPPDVSASFAFTFSA